MALVLVVAPALDATLVPLAVAWLLVAGATALDDGDDDAVPVAAPRLAPVVPPQAAISSPQAALAASVPARASTVRRLGRRTGRSAGGTIAVVLLATWKYRQDVADRYALLGLRDCDGV